jgi:hypothetical protein
MLEIFPKKIKKNFLKKVSAYKEERMGKKKEGGKERIGRRKRKKIKLCLKKLNFFHYIADLIYS